MAQPKSYSRDTDFAELKGSQADIGAKVNHELDMLGRGFDHVLRNLAKLQEDDGRLKSGVVDGDALAPETATGLRPATAWAERTKYQINDAVYVGYAVLRCKKAHKSTTFEADAEAGNWEIIVTFDHVIKAIDGVASDPGFKRVSDNMGAISAIAVNLDRLNVIMNNLEAIVAINQKLPELMNLAGAFKAIMRLDLDLASVVKVAEIADSVITVAGDTEKVKEAASMAAGFAAVFENIEAIQKVNAMINPLKDVAANLDAVLEAPLHAQRAEQAAARMEREAKYNT